MSQLIHAVARIRALESGLLSRSDVDRMLGASSFDEAFKVLYDFGYAMQAAGSSEEKDFEGVLAQGLYEVSDLYRSFASPEVLDILLFSVDRQNIRSAVKMKRVGASWDEFSELFLPYGTYSKDEVIKIVEGEKNVEGLSPVILKAIESSSARESDALLESHMWEKVMKDIAGNAFFEQYFSLLADIENIHRFLRDGKESQVIPYGTLPSSAFESNDMDEFIARLCFTRFAAAVKQGAEDFEKTQSYMVFDLLLENELGDFLRDASRGKIDGYAPLFAFFWRKERNAKLIRSILVSKKNHKDEDVLRRHLSICIL